jgi:hypothetical protein
MSPQHFALQVGLIVTGLFTAMLLCQEFGRRIGVSRKQLDPEFDKGAGAAEAAVFGILGLFFAFTFSGAGERFDERRHQIVDESSAIERAWLRLDLLPPSARPQLRQLFRDYLDSRLEAYRLIPDMKAVAAERARTAVIQLQIWDAAVAAADSSGKQPPYLVLLPAINEMFEIAASRNAAALIHPPFPVFAVLGVLALVGAILAGYGLARQARRNWLHVLGYSAVMTLSIYLIADLEFPRFGFVRIDAMDQVLIELRHTMK